MQDGTINLAAVKGALGAISAIEATDTTTAEYRRYTQLWSSRWGASATLW
jgi:hypothetical protein